MIKRKFNFRLGDGNRGRFLLGRGRGKSVSILGTVYGRSKTVLPGVNITATNTGTGEVLGELLITSSRRGKSHV